MPAILGHKFVLLVGCLGGFHWEIPQYFKADGEGRWVQRSGNILLVGIKRVVTAEVV